MAIPIRKFGQYVHIAVTSRGGKPVFSTDSLKVDFDVRHIEGWSRAKVSITNLNPSTIRDISNGDNYVTVKVRLHDSNESVIIDNMFISNAMEEKQVPQSVFNMFCYSKVRKDYLEEQVDVDVPNPSLRSAIKAVLRDAGFTGKYEYKQFPSQVLDYVPPRANSKKQGSLIDVLRSMGEENRFNVYTVGQKIVFMYRPTAENVADTSLASGEGAIKLSTTNMRSNPKIGPATLKVFSNLDPNIEPSSVLDITNLLTIGTSTSQAALEVAENILKDSVAGFSKYQAISVQHKGSNWTGEWSTIAAATSPDKGTSMNVDNWWA